MSTITNHSTATKVAALFIGIAMVLGLAFFVVPTMKAHAITLAELVELFIALEVIPADKAEQARSVLTSQSGDTSGGAANCGFTRDLNVGSSGADVKCLQEYLNSAGFTLATSGAGSPGNETNFFGSITKAGAIKWQNANAAQVLAPVGLSAGTGYWGSSSRSHYNTLVGSGGTTPTDPGTDDPVVTVPAGTGLTVSVATQPANTLAPDNAARVPFTKVILTAGSDGPVTVNSILVERTGLAADAVFTNVVLLDSDDTQIGLTKTLNSNHQAKVGTDFTVPAGTSKVITIAGTMASDNSTRDGEQVSIDVVSINTSATVTGSLPIRGATHTVNASLAIGAATADRGVDDPNTSDTKEIGTTGYKFSSIRITAGSAEDIRLRNIRFNQTGSAGKDDLNNVVVIAGGTEYPAAISSDGKFYSASFGDGIVIKKGFQFEVTIKGDLIGGANRTVLMDIDKNTDIYVTGELFGYGITAAAGSTATASDDTSQFTTGTPFYDASKVTISAGSVTSVSKSNSVPAQNIAINVADQVLGGFEIDIKGEPISVGQMVFNLSTVGNESQDLDNITLVDQNGAVIAGPVDAASTNTVTFTDTVTLATGLTVLTMKGQLTTDFANDDTVAASTTPSTDWTTITGEVTGNTISLSALSTAVTANTMTVKGATTTITVAADPTAQNVVAGVKQFTFANFQFDATESGEDVRVTSIQFRYTDGGSDPTNCLAYDGTTKLTDTAINPSGTGADTYTFNTALIIPSGTTKVVTLKCDVPASATATNVITFGINDADTMNAVGLGSGSTIIMTHLTANSGAMTIQSGGALTVEKDASSPSLLVASAGSTDVTLGVLKLRATNESITLNRIGLQLTAPAASSSASDITEVTLWDGATQVGTGFFTGSNTVATTTLTGSFVIPKDGEKILTVKGDLAEVGISKAGTQGALLLVDYDGDRTFATEGTGSSSGTSVKSGSSSDTAVSGVRMFQSFPTFAKVALSTNTLANGERSLLRFSVTADDSVAGRGIQVYKFTLRFATTTAILASPNIFAYTDSGFSIPVSGLTSDGSMESTAPNMTTEWASSSTDVAVYANTSTGASTTIQIPDGGTRYFEVRGTISNSAAGASISTQLQGDANFPAILALMSSTTANIQDSMIDGGASNKLSSVNDDFLWSPNATTTADLDSDDWTNGFGLIGLPSANMTAEVLSQ